MLAISSHHFIERTPSGEDAWRRSTMLPDDRKVLGELRAGKTVAVLLAELELDPGSLEVVLQRLARRGFVRIDVSGPTLIAPSEPTPDQNLEEQPDDALSSLLARHAPPPASPEVGSTDEVLEIAGAPPAAREPDESPLPVGGTPQDISLLMDVLKNGPVHSSVVIEKEAVAAAAAHAPNHDASALDSLMRALVGDGLPEESFRADLAQPPLATTRARKRDAVSSHHAAPGAVSSPRFLRMKDAKASPADSLVIPLPSLPRKQSRVELANDRAAVDAARREHAAAQRAVREAQAQARREEMAARRAAEQKRDEGDTLLGMSARLRRTLEEQKKS